MVGESTTQSACAGFTTSPTDTFPQSEATLKRPEVTRDKHDITLPNGVTIYGGDNTVINALTEVTKRYQDVWTASSFVNVPEEEWMRIPLKDDWETTLPVKKQAKVYPAGQKDKDVIDATFNKLHAEGHLEWTTELTPFSFPVFMVW